MLNNMTECATKAVMLDGEISKFVDISEGVAQECSLSPDLLKVYVSGMIVAIEAAKQGLRYGVGVDVCG